MSDSRAPSFRLSPAEFMAQQRRAANNDLASATPTQMVCDSIEAGTGFVFVREVGSTPGGDEVHAEPYPRLAGPPIVAGDLVMVAESIGRGESGGRSRFVVGPLGGASPNLANGTKTHDWGSIAAGGYESTTVSVSGVALGDLVLGVAQSATMSDLIVDGKVTAVNTVTVTVFNPTGAVINPDSGSLTVSVMRLT